MTLQEFKDLLSAVTPNVYHYRQPKGVTAPWVTWAEQSRSGLFGGDRREAYADHGVVDLFTKAEWDPLVAAIETMFCEAEVAFELEMIQYEEDTKLIHYTWSFEVA